jgi:hypothetical protein
MKKKLAGYIQNEVNTGKPLIFEFSHSCHAFEARGRVTRAESDERKYQKV